MLHLSRAFALLCAVSLTGAVAHTETFQVSGTFASGGSLSGTISIDNSLLVVNSVDLMVNDQGLSGVTPDGQSGTYLADLDAWEISWDAFPNGPSNKESALDLLIPVASTSMSGGGAVCALDAICAQGAVSQLRYQLASTDQLSTGGVSAVADPPTAEAPEPSTLLLLGTGLAGAAGAVRRRVLARR